MPRPILFRANPMNQNAKLFGDSSLTRHSLEHYHCPIVLTDASGTMLYANHLLESWFGFADAEIKGRPLQDLLPSFAGCAPSAQGARQKARCAPLRKLISSTVERPDSEADLTGQASATDVLGNSASREPIASESMSRLESPSSHVRVEQFVCRNGRQVPVLAQVSNVEYESAELLLVALDYPDANRLEPRDLESERLDAIATMISGLAHESRNALQRAVACLDLLDLDLRESKQLELSDKIRRSLSDLLENYDEVRRFALPMTLNRRPQPVLSLFEEAWSEFQEVCDVSDVSVEIDGHPAYESIARVDGDRLKEVFCHVIDNALYDQQAPITIKVESQRIRTQNSLSIPSNAIQITLHNDGPPFLDAALCRGIEPFFSTKPKGSGLGLSICRRIIEAHDGQIRLSNPPQGGASVEILLPLFRSADNTPLSV